MFLQIPKINNKKYNIFLLENNGTQYTKIIF